LIKKSVYYSIKDREYIYKNGSDIVTTTNQPKLSNIVTTIPLSKVHTTIVDIDALLHDDEIKQNIEFQAYEKLKLNMQKRYIIDYFKIQKHKYMVMVVSDEYLHNNILNKMPNIDLVTIAPLTYQTLYHNKIVPSKGVDCYIYFGEEESFYTIYKNGEIQSYELVAFSLRDVHKNNFSDIEYVEFCQMITTDKITLDYFSINILNILKASFTQYLSKYEISSFDSMFVDADCNLGSSLYKKANEIFEGDVKKLGFNTKLLGIDAISALSLMYSKSHTKHKDFVINFGKKIPYKTFLSNLALSMVASFVIAFALPIYQYIDSIQLKSSITNNTNKLNSVNQTLDNLLKRLKQKESIISQNSSTLKAKYLSYDKLISQIKNYSNNNIKRDRAQLLLYLTKHLNNSKVNLKNIKISTKNNNSSVELSLISKSQKNISKFLTSLKIKVVNIEVSYIKRVAGHYEADVEVMI